MCIAKALSAVRGWRVISASGNPSKIDAKRGDHFRYADFALLIAVSERQITSVWPTIYPEPWSSFPRTPFLARRGTTHLLDERGTIGLIEDPG